MKKFKITSAQGQNKCYLIINKFTKIKGNLAMRIVEVVCNTATA